MPPNGKVLPFDLSQVKSQDYLHPDRRGALYGLGGDDKPFSPARPPLVLVHGLMGRPGDLQAIANRFAKSQYQLYVYCYDAYNRRTSISGDDLASELRALVDVIGAGRALTILAHSMGGIVARRALLGLSYSAARGIERFSSVRLIGLDNPWHGYVGPADTGLQGLMMKMAALFMPDALEDMRASSFLFKGNSASADPVEHAGLYGQMLTPDVRIELVFANHRDEVMDYTMAPVSGVRALLASKIAHDTPVTGDDKLVNFFRALVDTTSYSAMRDELEQKAMSAPSGVLGDDVVLDALARHYPRFPGNHMTVLQEQPGGAGLIDELVRRLAFE